MERFGVSLTRRRLAAFVFTIVVTIAVASTAAAQAAATPAPAAAAATIATQLKPPAKAPANPPWSYELDLFRRDGQLHWHELPGFETCNGTQQSPIDIDLASVKSYVPGLKPEELERPQHWFGQHRVHDHPLTQQFERSTEVVIDNDSHTVFVTIKDDPLRPRNILSGAPLPPGAIYKMRALHFHAPAEHLINHVSFPLEMHVVYDLIQPSEEKPFIIEHAYPTSRNGTVQVTYSKGKTVTKPPATATPAAVVGYLFEQRDGCTNSVLSEVRKHILADKGFYENVELWRSGNNIPRTDRPKVQTRMDLSQHLLYPYAYEQDDDPCLLPSFDANTPAMPKPSPDVSVRDGKVHFTPTTMDGFVPEIPHANTPGGKSAGNRLSLKAQLRAQEASPENQEFESLTGLPIPSTEALLNGAQTELQELGVGKEYYDSSSDFAQKFELRGSGDADVAASKAARHSYEEDVRARVAKEAARLTERKRQEATLPLRGGKFDHAHSEAGRVRFGAAFPAFYSYRGSLTTPPCSQIITWLVGSSPIAASGEDLQFFWDLFYGNNRLPMPVNGRQLSRIGITAASPVDAVKEFVPRTPFPMTGGTKLTPAAAIDEPADPVKGKAKDKGPAGAAAGNRHRPSNVAIASTAPADGGKAASAAPGEALPIKDVPAFAAQDGADADAEDAAEDNATAAKPKRPLSKLAPQGSVEEIYTVQTTAGSTAGGDGLTSLLQAVVGHARPVDVALAESEGEGDVAAQLDAAAAARAANAPSDDASIFTFANRPIGVVSVGAFGQSNERAMLTVIGALFTAVVGLYLLSSCAGGKSSSSLKLD